MATTAPLPLPQQCSRTLRGQKPLLPSCQQVKKEWSGVSPTTLQGLRPFTTLCVIGSHRMYPSYHLLGILGSNGMYYKIPLSRLGSNGMYHKIPSYHLGYIGIKWDVLTTLSILGSNGIYYKILLCVLGSSGMYHYIPSHHLGYTGIQWDVP